MDPLAFYHFVLATIFSLSFQSRVCSPFSDICNSGSPSTPRSFPRDYHHSPRSPSLTLILLSKTSSFSEFVLSNISLAKLGLYPEGKGYLPSSHPTPTFYRTTSLPPALAFSPSPLRSICIPPCPFPPCPPP